MFQKVLIHTGVAQLEIFTIEQALRVVSWKDFKFLNSYVIPPPLSQSKLNINTRILRMENLTIAEIENLTLPRYAGGKVMSGKNSFELYVSFLWIFACIYVLSKLTQLLERVLAQRLLGQKQWCDVRSIENEWQLTLQLYEEDKRQLEAQVRELREKNLIMERMMVELRDCNIHLISANFMRSVMQDQVNAKHSL